MLLICDDNSVVFLLNFYFNKNYRPISLLTICGKNDDKQLIKNYRPISTTHNLQFAVKLSSIIFTAISMQTILLPKINLVSVQAIPHLTTYYIYLVNEIHEAFEDPKSLEVRAVFLDISHAVGLIFKFGSLIKLFEN